MGSEMCIRDRHSRSRTARSQAEIDALQMLADQVGSAMQNVQRYATALENTLAAERASQMKSRLLATLSHELRGPLKDRYKIKLDQYRIVYSIQDDIAIVQVLKAGKKTPGFYDDLA